MTFNRKYFLFTIILFVIEVLIALFIHDRFIRPYVGDYLVVILIYCAVRTIVKTTAMKAAVSVFLFACLIELLQYFRIVNRLGLSNNLLAKTIIGYGFEWLDILAYALGACTIFILENLKTRRLNKYL